MIRMEYEPSTLNIYFVGERSGQGFVVTKDEMEDNIDVTARLRALMKLEEAMVDTPAIDAIEEVAAKGATAPRVSKEDIEAAIDTVYYFTMDEAIINQSSNTDHLNALSIYTMCVIILKNGWVQTGHSAPASPENFDAEKGRTFAYNDAFGKLWPLLGFALRDRLHRDKDDTDAYLKATS